MLGSGGSVKMRNFQRPMLENLTSTRKSDVINKILRDRQTVLTPLLFAHRLRPDSDNETGRKKFCFWRKAALAMRRLVLIGLLIAFGCTSFAQEGPSEYQVKAAFLYNFAKFVEWPPGAFPDTNSPIVLGILGKNVFGSDLEKTIRDRKVNNHPFVFKTITSAAEATNCHILFISPSEKDECTKIVNALHNATVLTVSETDGFIKAGGMINFTFEDTKVRFQINDEAAKKAGLKISSKLLSLAVPSR
jgi:hypothetical protein